MKKSNKGFTLVELLVVIAIIGILASVVLVSLNSARGKARDARRISDLHQLSLALENYYDAVGSYPASTATLATAYISAVPVDPQNASAYGYNTANCTPANQRYVIKATLENNNPVLASDLDSTQCTSVLCGATPEVAGAYYYCIMP